MNKLIPAVTYLVGDLKRAFTEAHDEAVRQFGAEASSPEMTMGKSVVSGLKASLNALNAFADTDYITFPDVPSELTTALSPRLTKSLHEYVEANQYRMTPAIYVPV